MFKSIAAILLLANLGISAWAQTAPAVGSYSAKIKYQQEIALAFRDFSLTFKGRETTDYRTASGQRIPFGPRFVFELSTPSEHRSISWSSGTGVIAPANFRVGTSCFALELSYSDRLGKLAPDELVISQAPSSQCR
ncbi:MAG: hypothetical protein K1X83_03875 [Oligoflexia bacterium]|nr:hypothetical protein [Oligoflexia bacterium]